SLRRGSGVIAAVGRGAVAAAFLLGLASAAAAQISGALSRKSDAAAEILSIAQRNGHVSVIVQFDSPVPASAIRTNAAAVATVGESVAAVQDRIIAAHFGSATNPARGQGFARGLTRFDITPGFAVNVTESELQELAGNPLVQHVNYDRPMPPVLLQSVPLI